MRLECPVPIAFEHADSVVRGVGDDQIQLAVAVQVGNRDRGWPLAGGVVHVSRKGAVTFSKKNTDRVVRGVDSHEVLRAVVVEITWGEPGRAGARWVFETVHKLKGGI